MTANRQIALLRGINVGKAKRVAMADLRALLEALGYSDVRTLLNSGNAVYSAPPRTTPRAAAVAIEAALEKRLGVSARVTVLSAEDLASIVAGNPHRKIADDPSRLLVAVLMDDADRAPLDALAKRKWSPDAFAAGERVAYLWCVAGVLDSPLSQEFSRRMRDSATSRNWSTILKLHELVKHPT